MTKIETICNVGQVYQQAFSEELFQMHMALKLMQKLSTTMGFYDYYLQQLETFKTEENAFEFTNALYCKYFGCYKYRNFTSFYYSTNLIKMTTWKA